MAIWNACGDDDFGRIVRLLICTGCRPQEIGGMRAGEFDLEAGIWELPEERSKNHRAHLIDLPPAALKIIRMASPLGKRDHLFGARSVRGFAEWGHNKEALDRRLDGKVKPWQLRDLRRSVATKMGDIKIHPHVIEAVLNHHSGYRAGVAGVYKRSPYRDEVRAALARWSKHVLGAPGVTSSRFTLDVWSGTGTAMQRQRRPLIQAIRVDRWPGLATTILRMNFSPYGKSISLSSA